jgi:hypothetical protein
MKYAIGMLELTPFEVLGDPLFSQRYCSQVIIPLIGMLEAEGHLRITLIATGSVVEYLAENLPLVLKKIRALIEDDRIELLCSTYTNADWQIFPSSDLRRSRRMTDEILRRNGLPLGRTMVAQNNTYWPAVASFQHEFDVFLVRGTFLKGRRAARQFPQMARVGNSLLVVASNNLLHDMTAHLVSQKATDTIRLFIEGRLDAAVEVRVHSDPRFVDIAIGQDNWHWFHSGGAHHFTTGAGLRNWDTFFCDPDWMCTVQDFFEAKLNDGVAFRFVSEFTDAAGTLLGTLPDFGDASWDSMRVATTPTGLGLRNSAYAPCCPGEAGPHCAKQRPWWNRPFTTSRKLSMDRSKPCGADSYGRKCLQSRAGPSHHVKSTSYGNMRSA